jgi:hypothetical protein
MPGFIFAQSAVESGMRWLLKRWWFWAGTGFMLVAACAGYLVIHVGSSRITQENCDKIQGRWSREQVVSLIGNPTNGAFSYLIWEDEDGNSIFVEFSIPPIPPFWPEQVGFVTKKRFVPTKLSFFERVKRRVERRIRALWS